MMVFLCVSEELYLVIDYIHSVLQDLRGALEFLNDVLENNFLLEKPFFPTRLAQRVVCHKIHAMFSSRTYPKLHALARLHLSLRKITMICFLSAFEDPNRVSIVLEASDRDAEIFPVQRSFGLNRQDRAKEKHNIFFPFPY